MHFFRFAVSIGLLLILPAVVLAHPEHDITDIGHSHVGEGSGVMAGLAHPALGLDHLLVMVAVGLLAAQLGGRALWALPVTFIGAMLLGGLAGMQGANLPLVELAILASLAVFGMALALGKKLPLPLACAVVAFFAFFHGHAHGTEIPSMATPLFYAAGFVLSTALLHAVGVAAGSLIISRFHMPTVLRWTGAAIAVAAPLWLVL